MSISTKKTKPKAVLVGLQLPTVSDADHQSSLAELQRLVTTLGFEVVATLSQKRASPVTATVLGQGKLKELARLTGGSGSVPSRAPGSKENDEDVEDDNDELASDSDENLDATSLKDIADKVVFDCDLTPNQLRNLETATDAEVLDRTGVIVEIFHRHAKTREARIQVEIARLRYLAPRLRLIRVGGDRQSGGIGAKGVGETAHELDKRRIRDRIAELGRELETVRVSQLERQQRRNEQNKVALVGYTNAGKSSLMRALTGSEVYVEDKLFATLDTTIRTLLPETQPRILISDTVGFIKKLPHDLVASFRSTLDEAANASLLLYIVDASDPTFRAQYKVTQDVLHEINAADSPSILILNKVDCLSNASVNALKTEFPQALFLSAHNKDDVKKLRERIISHFELDMQEESLLIPYEKSAVIGELRQAVRVINESHGETGTTFVVRGYAEQILRIKKKIGQNSEK